MNSCTIGEYLEWVAGVLQLAELVGFGDGIAEEFNSRREAVAKAICQEQGVEWGSEEASGLDTNLSLGHESERLFQELKTWAAGVDERLAG